MSASYITGLTALCIPQLGRFKPFWHGIGAPDAWSVAGRNYPDTSCFFGEREIVDVSEFMAQSGIQTNLSRCASYERAVFDLLYHHIEQKNRTVPNVQPSDIDDVVDFDRVRDWVQQWEKAGKLIRGASMRAWLTSDGPWVGVKR